MADSGDYTQYQQYMVNVNRLVKQCKQWAAKYGAKEKTDGMSNLDNAYVFRNATQNSLKEPYFGFIRPEEQPTGPYSDFSLVVFTSPHEESNKTYTLGPVVVALGVGTNGFTSDGDLAVQPGVRRLFRKILNPACGGLKNDMSDIETSWKKRDIEPQLTSWYTEHVRDNDTVNSSDDQPQNHDDLDLLIHTVTGPHYAKYISAWQLVADPFSDEGLDTLHAFIAAYARLRDWGSSRAGNDANPSTYLNRYVKDRTVTKIESSDKDTVMKLLLERHFVVLQGAPGTGKTRMATRVIAPELITTVTSGNVIFTQFHAETTYSDFIYGIRPVLNPHSAQSNDLGYEGHEGPLVTAIRSAQKTPDEPVLLIIDEINRANLPNVLGQAFYLFERDTNTALAKTGNRPALEIAPGLRLASLPDNLYVIATMNTADRSIAVVDFALRRRFAWYTLRPTIPDEAVTTSLGKAKRKQSNDSDCFYEDVFNFFAVTFDWYANDEELSLQPGQGYFFARDDDEMKDRLRYELMPLIKEYLTEGYLKDAANTFSSYFRQTIGEEIYA